MVGTARVRRSETAATLVLFVLTTPIVTLNVRFRATEQFLMITRSTVRGARVPDQVTMFHH